MADPTLIGATITFQTNDDDKNDETLESNDARRFSRQSEHRPGIVDDRYWYSADIRFD